MGWPHCRCSHLQQYVAVRFRRKRQCWTAQVNKYSRLQVQKVGILVIWFAITNRELSMNVVLTVSCFRIMLVYAPGLAGLSVQYPRFEICQQACTWRVTANAIAAFEVVTSMQMSFWISLDGSQYRFRTGVVMVASETIMLTWAGWGWWLVEACIILLDPSSVGSHRAPCHKVSIRLGQAPVHLMTSPRGYCMILFILRKCINHKRERHSQEENYLKVLWLVQGLAK